jgi:hypothetical protein
MKTVKKRAIARQCITANSNMVLQIMTPMDMERVL